MKRTLSVSLAVLLLLTTAHRLPAPITEVETPTPAPAAVPSVEPKLPPQPPPLFAPESKKVPVRAKERKSTTVSESTTPAPKAAKEISSKEGTSIPKGAVHLVIHTEADARKIFNYFIFPRLVAKPGTTGLYRIEVGPDGTVAAVTILKSMGPEQDVLFMKAFITWRAAPGPLRLVDVPRRIYRYYRVGR